MGQHSVRRGAGVEWVLRLRISRPAAQILLGILFLGYPYGTLMPAGVNIVPYDLTMSATMPQPMGAYNALTARGKTLLATIQGVSAQNNLLIGQNQPCGSLAPGTYAGLDAKGFIRDDALTTAVRASNGSQCIQPGLHQVTIQSSPDFPDTWDPLQGSPDIAKLVVAGSIRVSRLIWGRAGDPGALNVREWPFELGNVSVDMCINPTVDAQGNITCSVGSTRPTNKDHVHMTWTVYNSTGYGGTDAAPPTGSGLYFPGVSGYFRTWVQRCNGSGCGAAAGLPQWEVTPNPSQPAEQMPGTDGQLHDNSKTPDIPTGTTVPTYPLSSPYCEAISDDGGNPVTFCYWRDMINSSTGQQVWLRCRYTKEAGPFPVNLDGDCWFYFPSGSTGSFPYQLQVSQCCRPGSVGCTYGC